MQFSPRRFKRQQPPLGLTIATPQRRAWWLPYAAAGLTVGAALALSLLARELVEPIPFVLFWGAVAVSAWYGGLGAGVLAIVLTVPVVNYYFLGGDDWGNIDLFDILRLALFVFIGILVSALHRTQHVVRQQREWLWVALSGISDAVVATDSDGRVIVANPAAAALMEISTEEATGKWVDDLFQIESGDSAERAAPPSPELLVSPDIGSSHHVAFVAPSGRRIPVAQSGGPISDKYGRAVGNVLVFHDLSERRHAEETLRDAERRLRSVLDQLTTFVLVLGPDGVLKEINRPALQAANLTNDDALGQRFDELHWWSNAPEVQSQLREAMARAAQGDAVNFDAALRLSEGRQIAVELNLRPVPDADGKLAQIIASAVDVTVRRATEQRLAQERELLKRILVTIPVMITVFDPAANVTMVNEEFTRVLGWKNEELADVDIMQVCYPDPAYREAVRHYMQAAQTEWRDFDVTAKDGTIVESSWSNVTLQDERLIGIGVDVRARKRAERALRASEARARRQVAEIEAMYDSVPIGLCLLDTELRFTRVNEQLAEMNGISVEDHIGHTVRDIIPGLADIAEPRMQHIIETGEPYYDLELSGETAAQPDVEKIWSQSVVPIKDPDGRVIGLNVVVEDVTERKREERRLRHLQELTAALAAVVTFQDVADAIAVHYAAAAEADTCAVHMLQRGDRIIVVSSAGFSGVARLWTTPYSIHDPVPTADAIRTQQPVWLASADECSVRYPDLKVGDLPPGHARAILPIMEGESAVGAISLSFAGARTFSVDDQIFVLSLLQVCSQALERARLFEQAQETAALEERHRLARDLHDAVSQALFTINTIAQALPRLWQRGRQEMIFPQLEQLGVLTRGAQAEMRVLLLELRPEQLLHTELSVQYQQLTDALRSRKLIEVALDVDEQHPVPPLIQLTLYRIAQESLNNVIKHAQARRVEVTLRSLPDQVMLRVCDDGKGFAERDIRQGLGLKNMRERAQQAGAHIEIAGKPGQGTTVTVVWRNNGADGSRSSLEASSEPTR